MLQPIHIWCWLSALQQDWTESKTRFIQQNHPIAPHRIQQTEHLPETLKDAIEFFEKSSWIREILGEEFCQEYIKEKKNEWLRYVTQVTDWEVEEYLYRL